MESGVVRLYCTLTTGSSGAVTSAVGKGISSCALAGGTAGKYTFTLQDTWKSFLMVDAIIRTSDGLVATGKGRECHIIGAPTGSSIVVQFDDGAGAAAQLPDSAIVYFRFTMKQTST